MEKDRSKKGEKKAEKEVRSDRGREEGKPTSLKLDL